MSGFEPPADDDMRDLTSPIGTNSMADCTTRTRCLELAVAVAPKFADCGWADVLWIARRFARFAIVGDTPNIVARPQEPHA